MTWPLVMAMSSQPSLSKSRKRVPKPTYFWPMASMPDGVVGDVDVEQAVAVEVGDGNAEAFAALDLHALGILDAVYAQAGGLADVFEGAVLVVAEEPVRQAGELARGAHILLDAGLGRI